jgi:hypothetical protein
MAEAALVGFLVNLRATDLVATTHDVDDGFLAAHELADDFVDEAFLDERLDSGWGFDGRLSARPGTANAVRREV